MFRSLKNNLVLILVIVLLVGLVIFIEDRLNYGILEYRDIDFRQKNVTDADKQIIAGLRTNNSQAVR